MTTRTPLEFLADSLEVLKTFPEDARRKVGQQLAAVQRGEEPVDWKPMSRVGPGVREIRIRDHDGIYRVLYVTRFGSSIYVLHCFQKKTQKTSPLDLEKATRRYNLLQKEYSA